MRLSISDAARRDLRSLYDYGVDNYGRQSANQYLDAITLAIERIPDWPLANRLRTEVRPPVRLFAHAAHNVFYDVRSDEVEIIRVLHHAADWVNIL